MNTDNATPSPEDQDHNNRELNSILGQIERGSPQLAGEINRIREDLRKKMGREKTRYGVERDALEAETLREFIKRDPQERAPMANKEIFYNKLLRKAHQFEYPKEGETDSQKLKRERQYTIAMICAESYHFDPTIDTKWEHIEKSLESLWPGFEALKNMVKDGKIPAVISEDKKNYIIGETSIRQTGPSCIWDDTIRKNWLARYEKFAPHDKASDLVKRLKEALENAPTLKGLLSSRYEGAELMNTYQWNQVKARLKQQGQEARNEEWEINEPWMNDKSLEKEDKYGYGPNQRKFRIIIKVKKVSEADEKSGS